ncbi:efflux RND transporter periplasmic adaptor subunit [Parvularcula dongshanensis]|uniref:Membrane fusion protein (Multidrug efflux system) n=1 Tax=Parvularcula dongshanensis TaxID=1173995 RepID=A0A840I6J9_9PROT|nr:efflux RND transporter periplasmic adaptor subunit [Parvularcula dongshanensis]MBB4660082.1 membrane fusion protein (multidrug efflux system) [Parvularcula dongshanensis]
MTEAYEKERTTDERAEREARAAPMLDTPEPERGAAAEPTSGPSETPKGRPKARRRGFLLLGLVVLVAAAAYGVHSLFFAPPTEETDDAYVAGDIVAITARDAGTVTAIYADDTERVEAGQPLVDLDPVAADAALDAAAAELARAVRTVRADTADVTAAEAAVAQARSDLAAARDDLARRGEAANEGAVSGEELAHARDAVRAMSTALDVANSRLAQARSHIQGTDVRSNPAVLSAAARYRQAAITRSHMHVVAPVDGIVAQRTAQLGQQVGAGAPLMSVVPLGRVWVDANFRETQLADLRIGQPVRITTDTYGDDVAFSGRVAGLGAGSGSAFALLPPQNASGNWIKIVQRVPVRVELDQGQLAEHPLRIGLSVRATVDTNDTSGALTPRPARAPYVSDQTRTVLAEADAEIDRIIGANTEAQGASGVQTQAALGAMR